MNETATAWCLGGLGALQGVYREVMPAKRAWMAIGAFVVAHDVLCGPGEMLSEGVDVALEKHKAATTLAVAAVALHLINRVPESLDPLHQATVLARRWAN